MAAQPQDVKASDSEYEQVKADLKALREDLGKLSKSVTEGQKRNLHGLSEELRREGQDALNYARGAGEKALHDAEECIAERPFLTVILLFLAGLVVGKLLDR